MSCPSPDTRWELPQLDADFGRCELVEAFNTAAVVGLVAVSLCLFLLAYIAFGRA